MPKRVLVLWLLCLAVAAQEKVDPRGQTILSLQLEARSSVRGAAVESYLKLFVEPTIRKHWYQHVPFTAKPPIMRKGTVIVEFKILQDGKISSVRTAQSSGDTDLDRGVITALTEASPLAALPESLHGTDLAMRAEFVYNPDQPSTLIRYHDATSMFLPDEFRIGVKLTDESKWTDAGAYVEEVVGKLRSAWFSQLREVQLPSSPKTSRIKTVIQPDGKLTYVTVTDSSGDTKLDRAAMAAIDAIQPLPALPGKLGDKPLEVSFNFQYDPKPDREISGSQ